jgi:phosphate transport system protein
VTPATTDHEHHQELTPMRDGPPDGPSRGTELRHDFHAALDALDDRFVANGLAVADALPRLTADFLAADHDAIADAIELSGRIADECYQIEDRCFVLLAREQPVSRDLRRLVALLRLTTDVDRSASLLKHVCSTLLQFDPRLLPEDVRGQVSELADRSGRVFSAGIDAWRRRDALAVTEVDAADDAVDDLQKSLLECAASLEEAGDEMLVLGLIARYYERIADHGVAVAQDAAFVATGQRVVVGKYRPDDA